MDGMWNTNTINLMIRKLRGLKADINTKDRKGNVIIVWDGTVKIDRPWFMK